MVPLLLLELVRLLVDCDAPTASRAAVSTDCAALVAKSMNELNIRSAILSFEKARWSNL